MTDPFERREHSLENEFFFAQDQKLLEEIREKEREKAGREKLAQVTGIRRPELIDELIGGGIRAESLVALSLVPLIYVARADRIISVEERDEILKAAANEGIAPGTASHQLLTSWLERDPGTDLLEAWRHYITHLAETLNPNDFEAIKVDILHRCRRIAECSGGALETESHHAKVKSMLAHIESAMVRPASD